MYHLLLEAQVPATKLYKGGKFGGGLCSGCNGCREEGRQSSIGRDIGDE
ncbi:MULTISPECIES: hypothetical protein [unclassified Microcoleus]|nr:MULTISPECIES: hypothetical protein [unclassified Microcoleus]